HDVAADAVHRQHPARDEHPGPEVADLDDVAKAFDHASVPWRRRGAGAPASQRPEGRAYRVSADPPAAAILAAACPLKRWARMVSAFVTSPRARIFTGASPDATSPRSRSSSGVTTVPASNTSAIRSTFTTSYSRRKMLVKPRFGRRRCSGICPPSKPRFDFQPDRDWAPLWPRPAVFPLPLPWPRPTRKRFRREPSAGFRLLRSTAYSSSTVTR